MRWSLLVVLVVGGSLAVGACGSGSTPAATGPVITISLVHGGAGVAELEAQAVEPVEQAVSGLTGVRALRSTIEPGRALVAVSFEASRPIHLAADEVMRAVQQVQRQLPAGLDPPAISRVDPDGPVLWFELSGDQPRAMLSDLARQVIARRLERLAGVSAIELDGTVERRIEIRPDLAKLAAFGIALSEVAASIRSQSIAIPGGRLDVTSATAATIRVTGKLRSIDDIAGLVVITRGDASVRLRDVAVIEDAVAGTASGPLSIGARLQRGADREEVLASVRSAIAELHRELPPRLKIVESSRPPPGAPRRAPAPLAISLRGPDRATLGTIAAKLESELRASNAVSEVARIPPPGRPEHTIDIDRARAAQLGIPIAEIAATTRALLGADPLGTLGSGGRELEIVLRVEGDLPEILARVTVRASSGEHVPLSAVATITNTSSEHLLRIDRERAVELAVHAAPDQPLAAARRRLVELVRELPPGYRAIISP
jgi:multidrug efflux pump subunit AcrB